MWSKGYKAKTRKYAAADTLIHARSRNGVKPLSSRREGIMPMGILCADSAIGTMGD